MLRLWERRAVFVFVDALLFEQGVNIVQSY